MKAIHELGPDLARHILDRMGSTGQPPERGARLVNVATEDLLEILRAEYLVPMRTSGRNSSFKLVQAPFGGGKTHFLHCLRELAWSEGFSTALVGLSPKECPFDRPVLIYRAVARMLELPVQDIEEQPQPGLPAVLRRVARRRAEAAGKEAFLRWLDEEFAEAPVESLAVLRAVRGFLEAELASDRDAREELGDYLLGEKVDPEVPKRYRLREQLDDENAFRWLRSVVQCLAHLGLPGVVLMFDEMDRNMSLGTRRRRDIGDNLRQMIDYCGQSLLPGVLWCYAVPPEFMTTIVPEYPALAQRLEGLGHFAAASPLQPVIDLDRLPVAPTDLLTAIGMRLLDLARCAHGEAALDADLQARNLETLAVELGERQLESGTRRQFVRAAVALLESQRRGGESLLDGSEVRALIAGGRAGEGIELPGEVEF